MARDTQGRGRGEEKGRRRRRKEKLLLGDVFLGLQASLVGEREMGDPGCRERRARASWEEGSGEKEGHVPQ